MAVRLLCFVLLLHTVQLQGQVCVQPGQTPSTAKQVCGNGVFIQSPVEPCRNNSIYVPGCTNEHTNYGDNNPFYYRFTCTGSGTLAFDIAPVYQRDDYNWQLFDITGHNPDDIFRDKTLIITGNWSGSYGATGARAGGVNYIQCRSDPFLGDKPTFSNMPSIIAGHDYLLMVGCNDNAAQGYTLTVGGGTAIISNGGTPVIKAGAFSCDNKEILVSFSKKILCSSIAADGSDFNILPAGTILSVTPVNCTAGNLTDSVKITFSNALPDGAYELLLQNGTDGNTLMDNCGITVPAGTKIPFRVDSYAALDSLQTPGCAPGSLTILFSKPVRCASVASNGTDFNITGTGTVTINSATAVCDNNGFTHKIGILLSRPIYTNGSYKLVLQKGSDGNTLLDACGMATPEGTYISFTTKDTVNAEIGISIKEGCVTDTVVFSNPGNNGISSWLWTFENGSSQHQQRVQYYTSGGAKPVELVVSNGVCSATAATGFFIRNKLRADFMVPVTVCPAEPVIFTNTSIAASSWYWDFGNGITSNLQQPAAVLYPVTGIEKKYPVTLTVTNNNCSSTITKLVTVNASCTIAVPNVFTPNADGINDWLGPLNTGTVNQLQFSVYNRYGQRLFKSGAGFKWDGTFNGTRQPVGVYAWELHYSLPNGQPVTLRGSSLLLR
ncbi:MAG: gliding motility-associated C-terminal domain-containing protein [Ferruginibacter sp.]